MIAIYENVMKIDLRNRQGRFGSEALRILLPNLRRRCQYQELSGRPRRPLSVENGTLLKSRDGILKRTAQPNLQTCNVFRVQEAFFEGCTFPMWPPCRPQTTKSGKRKLKNGNHALNQSEVVFGQLDYKKNIFCALFSQIR